MRSHLAKLLAIFVVFGVVAAACGDSSDDETTSDDTVAEQDEATDERASGDASGEDEVVADGEPVRGGRLVYGIEADSSNPWVHYATSCAVSCRMIFRAITDALFIADDAGEIQPYLVDTFEASDDYTEWTMTIKEGITFHDGTPLDGEAVKYNIDTCRFSPLTGAALSAISDTAADGQTVTVTYNRPDAIGPKLLRTETCGMMFSPTWMQTLPNNPLLTEEEVAEATGDPSAPVGLGAFKYVSYTPGPGNSFIAERNEDYWRGDGPNSVTGEGLPYLDEIEFVVAVDIQGRSNGLQSGQFDIIHTANADEIAKFEADEDYKLLQANDFGETSYILLNVAQGENPTVAAVRGVDSVDMDPTTVNAANPLVHLSCRTALAQAIDLERYVADRGAGIVTPANGPFPPGSVGYLEDTGYPTYDPDAAVESFEQCKTDYGTTPISFTFNTTNDAFNVESNELIASMWSDAFGDEIDVSIAPIEQGQYINLALAGAFQAQGWRNHGGVDPAEQWYWWHSATAFPIDPSVPELALNFGRFQDPAMDEQYGTILANPDPAARQAAAEEVNRLFGENVWNLWTYWTLWGIVSSPRVQNVTNLEIPGYGTTMPVISGKHHLTQMWCLEGDCQG
jgi:peptide/nickel transport system substrate-binding protein